VKQRLDVAALERGLARSRAHARALIDGGRVLVNGQALRRAASTVHEDDAITIAPGPDFVSRGGHKLDAALGALAVSVDGAVCADVGASTGGFTDCLLRRGARRVYAVDVGTAQLDPALSRDPRVTVMDGVNARALRATDFDEPLELVVVDASFISLGALAAALAEVLPAGSELLALVKPQFEVGRAAARRGRGVVRDSQARERAIEGARLRLAEAGFELLGSCDSALAGPRGNLEHFLHARRRG